MTQYCPLLIPYRKGAKWGYTNARKEVIIDLIYDEAGSFHW